MEFSKKTCEEFVQALASASPVPGGGGASAFAGALGAALGNMVGNLTVGKKKYAHVEADILALQQKATQLQQELLSLMEKDAKAFEPLSKAYGLPKGTPEEKAYKEQVMEAALREASRPPLEIMEKACEAIELHGEFAKKGSDIAISDVGVGVSCCKSALLGASLNVLVNTKWMKDRDYAKELNQRAEALVSHYASMADEIFGQVREKLV